jgi:hypothetical protein
MQEVLDVQRFGRTLYLTDKAREIKRTSSFQQEENSPNYERWKIWLAVLTILATIAGIILQVAK